MIAKNSTQLIVGRGPDPKTYTYRFTAREFPVGPGDTLEIDLSDSLGNETVQILNYCCSDVGKITLAGSPTPQQPPFPAGTRRVGFKLDPSQQQLLSIGIIVRVSDKQGVKIMDLLCLLFVGDNRP
jgi:hypothetical protein